MNQPIARPVRFIQQRVDSHPELATRDPLSMLGRTVSA
jgi:hypothetical protein